MCTQFLHAYYLSPSPPPTSPRPLPSLFNIMIWSIKCSRTALLAVCVAFLAQPCNGLDGTIGCSEFNGDVFLTTSGSAVERAGIAVELGKLASACHQATAEEEEIDDEPIGLADWPDDDVSVPMLLLLRSFCCFCALHCENTSMHQTPQGNFCRHALN